MQLHPRYGADPVISLDGSPAAIAEPAVRQRRRLAETLATFTDDQWAHPSRCEGWSGRDVIVHLDSTNSFWTYSIEAGLRGEPTTLLATFDPVASPAEFVDASTGRSADEVLESFLASAEALIDLLASLDEGRALIGGRRYRELDVPSRTVGAALETNSFHPGRSGRNHLRILAQATAISFDRVDDVLDLVGLSDAAGRHAGTYSLGMRQRLGLAAALLGDPPILVLDEPGNGLDPQGVRSLRELLRARAAAGDIRRPAHAAGECCGGPD